jgi:hypothetical protein
MESFMSHFRLALVALALVATSACQLGDSSLVHVQGAVRHYSIEGGFWAVRGDDSTTYDPLGGLPAAFQQDGLRVFLDAKIRSDLAGVHAAGPVVEIIAIRRL